MMLKLNITAFVNGLAALPEGNENEPLFGTGYLTEHIALPFLFGKDISLYEIDWGAFQPEDARDMYYRCEEADQLETPILMLYAPAVSARPAADHSVRFV